MVICYSNQKNKKKTHFDKKQDQRKTKTEMPLSAHNLVGKYDEGLPKTDLYQFLYASTGKYTQILIGHEYDANDRVVVATHFCLRNDVKRIRSRNENIFDFEGHHCELENHPSVKVFKHKVEALKAMDPCFKGDIQMSTQKKSKNGDQSEKFFEALEYAQECKQEKELYAANDHSESISKKSGFFEKVMRYCKKCPLTAFPKFSMDSFRVGPITDWSTSWCIFGNACCGKTQYALAHFPMGALIVSNFHDIVHFNPDEHEGILFDDVKWELSHEQIIHILDVDLPRSFKIGKKTIVIPPNTKKIFTHNDEDVFKMLDIDMEQQKAISRRYQVMNVYERMF